MRTNKVISSHRTFGNIALIVLFTIFGFNRCKNVDKISEAQVFRYNEDVSVNTLDPIYIKSQSEIWIGSQIYEGLVALDDKLQPIPRLSKYWEISPDGRVYKFVIRTDAFFTFVEPNQNGKLTPQLSRVTVNDVAYSLNRLMNPKNGSPGMWVMNNVDKAPRVLNDSTVEISLKNPAPAFLSLLATNYCWIVPEFTQKWQEGRLSQQPVGAGPFYLRRWETDVKLVMLKNPQYFVFDGKQRLPFLDAVNVTFVKNKQTAFMQFMAGQYDFFNGIDGSFKNKLLNQNGTIKSDYQQRINAVVTDFLNTEYIGFYLGDTLKGKPNPFRDKHLRKALQLSVNRPEILRFFRNGLGSEAVNEVYGFVPPSLLGDQNSQTQSIKNPQKSEPLREFQNSEFFKNPSKFAKISLTTTADYLDIAVMLQNTWKKTLNLDVAIELQTGGMLRQLREKGDLGMFRGSWIADYPDAENYLGCFYSPYLVPFGPNYTRFVSKEFDQLYDEISTGIVRSDEDLQKRNSNINKANQILSEEAPFILLYFDKSLRLMQKNIEGLSNDPINRLDLRRVRLKTRFKEAI